MEIERRHYLQQLIDKKDDGMVKVVTGIRRCGKSYLLDPLYRKYLLAEGVPSDHIIKFELDRAINRKYHGNAELLERDILSLIIDSDPYYLILDEIQLVEGFEFVVCGLLHEPNIDIYVTGSNSRFLSSDIITEFRGRGEQIHVNPLSFSEFYAVAGLDKTEAWNEYLTYGGMPLIVSKKSDNEKAAYLKDLFEQTYFRDITERHGIKRSDVMDTLVNILASSVGSLTNPQKIFETFKSNGEKELSLNTVISYLSFAEDAFIVKKALRYDIKGRKYINTPQKYYFADLGLRNARLNFRQQEESHLMENAIFNELVMRGYNVDVGVVEIREGSKRIQTEVDFVCNLGGNRYYVQSALNLSSPEKTIQESRSLNHISDSFKKIIVVKDRIKPWRTEDGILVLGIIDFLLDETLMER
ncbi:MAG: ATP-binding protein [Clostridiales bacterium]|mgnify:CR=1 FL=1|nr:ATP-binding protein [Clostridiales bacterium]